MKAGSDTRVFAGLLAIAGIGVLLRTIEYAALSSLWIDELFIALNVTNRGWNELLSPLEYNQVAPIGFLVAVKLGATLLGSGEAGLRLFPYLASVAGIVLFWRLASRFLSPPSLAGALAVFALSPTLLWYARNVKQYSGDVAAVLLIVLLALRLTEGRDSVHQATLAGLCGGVALLFSQPSVLVAGVLIVVLFLERYRSHVSLRPFAHLAVGWLTAAVIVVVTSLILSPIETREYMREGWSHLGFLPWGPEAVVWIPVRIFLLSGLFVGGFQADTGPEAFVAGGFTVLTVMGAPWLIRRNGYAAAMLFTPVIVGILASAARVLPLSGRVSLYIGPCLLISAFGAVDQLRSWLPSRLKVVSDLATLGLVAVPLLGLVVISMPSRKEEARLVIRELRSRWRPGDVIYVIPAGARAMEFYGTAQGLKWKNGTADNKEPRKSLHQVDILRGRSRAWIFYTHTTPCHQALIRSYLDTIGQEVERIPDPYGLEGKSEAAAYLYDLSDPGRLMRANASSFPAPESMAENCGYSDRPSEES